MKHTSFAYIALGALLLALAGLLGSSLTGLFTFSQSGAGTGSATLEIQGTETVVYTISLRENMTAFDMLIEKAEVGYKEYDFGRLITSIDGLEQDGNHYWMFFVDGKPPSYSADMYMVSNGDAVSFLYLDSEQAMSYFG